MLEIIHAVPACLFAAALAYAAHVALDLGRRWIAMRDRAHEAEEAVQICHRAIEKFAEAIRELEKRVIDLEETNKAEDVASRMGARRRREIPMGM